MHKMKTSLVHTFIQTESATLELVSIIGQGSFATVYLAIDTSTGREYAAKTFKKATLSANQSANIRNEAKVMKLLKHQNIAEFHAMVETAEYIFIIMEKCEMDLFEAITLKGGFPDPVVRDVFGQICDAVSYAHSMGIYHRDIKPENILISSDFRVKLTDYGCGSVRYMSPECLNIKKSKRLYSTAANDTWGCGVLLINLLFGKNPWHEASLNDPIYARYVSSDSGILTRQFRLSKSTERVFSLAFTAEPNRISLQDLKHAVLSVDSFVVDGRTKADLRIDTAARKDEIKGPDSGFDDSSPVSRVKSRMRMFGMKIFG